METTTCKECGRVFFGWTKKQVENNLLAHMNVHAANKV